MRNRFNIRIVKNGRILDNNCIDHFKYYSIYIKYRCINNRVFGIRLEIERYEQE
jgi:hypothetical protein